MLSNKIANEERILRLAEAELIAFLRGTKNRNGSLNSLVYGNAWIDTMTSLKWPEGNFQGFFREVTMLTLARLPVSPLLGGGTCLQDQPQM